MKETKKITKNFLIKIFVILSLYLFFCGDVIAVVDLWHIDKNDSNISKQIITYIQKKPWNEDVKERISKLHDQDIKLFFEWLEYQDKNFYQHKFSNIRNFVENYSYFPKHNFIKHKAQDLTPSWLKQDHMLSWLSQNLVSVKAKLLLLNLISSDLNNQVMQKKFHDLVVDIWIENQFNSQQKMEFYNKYHQFLNEEVFLKRIDKLIWGNKFIDAYNDIKFLRNIENIDITHKRLRLLQNIDNADFDISIDQLRNNSQLLYAFLYYKNKNNEDKLVKHIILNNLPSKLPYPQKWWPIISRQIFDALGKKEYKIAYLIASNSHQETDPEIVEANWLKGWIMLRFFNKPNLAYKHFYSLYQYVKKPISVARTHYWLARTAQSMNNLQLSRKLYLAAAKYPVTFYGQLAITHLNQGDIMFLLPKFNNNFDYKIIKDNKLIKIGYFLIKIKEFELAEHFLKQAAENTILEHELMYINELAKKLPESIAINISKIAVHKNVMSADGAYPIMPQILKHTGNSAIAHAIIRQESMFNKNAVSDKQATGLFQITDIAERDISQLLKIPHKKKPLSDIQYNLMIGDNYIKKLIKQYNGSLLLAFAAYNAGAKNTNQWIELNGDPRKMNNIDDIVDWIEKIPYKETRNYVMRVIEGMNIYKFLIGGKTPLSAQSLLEWIAHYQIP